MPDESAPTMRRDIASAYAVTAARIASWVVVAAIVFRQAGAEAFAMLALIRATIGLLNCTSVGLLPAMVHTLAGAAARDEPPRVLHVTPPQTTETAPPPVLPYASPAAPPANEALARIYANGEALAILSAAAGFLVTLGYVYSLHLLHDVRPYYLEQSRLLALFFGLGVIFRLMSEAPASLLQIRGRIALDNMLVVAAEVAWVVLVLQALPRIPMDFAVVGVAFAGAGFFLLIARNAFVLFDRRVVAPKRSHIDRTVMKTLLGFGLLVVFAQAADFLYAPIDYILINRLIDPVAVADYAPAVQIDAGLLLLVSGLAAVLLPHSAMAHAAGDVAAVRRWYIRGTIASLAMLLPAAVLVWLISPWIFRFWLGDEMTTTQAILPLVLIHTVIGGSAAVGRSVLLAVGKVRPFTISVLAAGVANVILSYIFVRYFGLGLYGIVLGTIIVVTLRAGVWMPWYVLREVGRRKSE